MSRTRSLFALALLAALALAWWLSSSRSPRRTEPSIASRQAPESLETSTSAPTSVRPRPRNERAITPVSAVASEEPPALHGLFEGEVVSEVDARGVAGATVTLSRDGTTRTLTTRADGRFSFAPDVDGRYEVVTVTAAGYLPLEPGLAAVAFETRPGSAVRGLVLRLTPAVDYAGVVQTREGAPVASARVRSLDGSVDELRSDARGEFRVHAADGTLFEVTHPAYATTRAALDLAAQVSHRMVVTLLPRSDAGETAAVIEGRVVDGRGDPVEGARVSAVRTSATPLPTDEAARYGATSQLDGRFTLGDVAAGSYTVTASLAGMASARREGVPSGTSSLVLALADGSAVEGRVTDARTGAPLAGFTVVASRFRGSLERDEAVTSTVYRADGRYTLRGLGDGEWALSAVAAGRAPAAERRVTLSGEDRATVDFALVTGATLSGRVQEPRTGRAIEGARVSLEGSVAVGSTPVATRSDARSDQNGAFELRGLATGACSLFIAASDHHARVLSGVEVRQENTPPLVIELTPTAPGETPRIELTGIGAVLGARGDAMVIGRVIAGGGAAEAGLREGDAIVAVDGAPVTSLGFDGTIQRIRGPEGSVVVLTLRRGDAGVTQVPVVRRRIQA